MSNPLENRRRWFEQYCHRVEQAVKKSPQPGLRFTCPCCGYLTLLERGGYDICELCSWEDDGQDDPHADEVWGGPNGAYSLTEARMNFTRYLIKYNPDKPTKRIGGSTNSPLEHQAKRAIVEAFDAMVNESDQAAYQLLWQRVFDNEKILKSELDRKIREYESQMKEQGSP
jgi:hypothetical protein